MKALYFDMDGTLIDSRADLAAGVNATRRDLGLKPLPVATVVGFVGNGARYLLEHAIPEVAGRFVEIRAQYMANYIAHALDETVLYPGVRETLGVLCAAGWTLGINTNKPGEATRRILAHFGLAEFFGAAVVGGGDCAELKPSPLPLIDCAVRMGRGKPAQPDVMIGDNWTDLECGRRAGVGRIFCAWGFGFQREAACDARAERFADLPALVRGLEKNWAQNSPESGILE